MGAASRFGSGSGSGHVTEACLLGSGEDTEFHSENNRIHEGSNAGQRCPLSVFGMDGPQRARACCGGGRQKGWEVQVS